MKEVIEATNSIQKRRNGINNPHDHVYSERMKDQKNKKQNLLTAEHTGIYQI